MREANLYTLSRLSELHFIFAGFFDADPLVFIRLGHAARPYRTMARIARMAPWPLSNAVIAHIGDIHRAEQFERRMFHRLRAHRTYGDWFCFDGSAGLDFADVARLTYAECTGRRLQWRHMALPSATRATAQDLTRQNL
jgi:hypothetical protein